MDFNVADIKSEINDWIKDLKECQENARRKFESMEDPTPEDLRKRNNISSDAVLLISQYENLKMALIRWNKISAMSPAPTAPRCAKL